jgi:ribosomal protein S18 acetylase RimI-like enzyme
VLAFTARTWQDGDYIPRVWDAWLAAPHGTFVVGVGADDTPRALGKLSASSPTEGWLEGIRVAAAERGRGLGRALARHAVHDAVALGLAKLVVEVIADQTALIGMFQALGFEPEALLADHVRDRSGTIRDLLVLANDVESQFAAMTTAGITDEL